MYYISALKKSIMWLEQHPVLEPMQNFNRSENLPDNAHVQLNSFFRERQKCWTSVNAQAKRSTFSRCEIEDGYDIELLSLQRLLTLVNYLR